MGRLKILKSIDLQITHHLKSLDARCQERLVQSDDFVKAWNISTIEERKKILFLLKNIKPSKLRELIDTKIYGKLEYKSMLELRRQASYYRIKNYSRKTRQQLLTEIEREEENERKSEDSNKQSNRCKN